MERFIAWAKGHPIPASLLGVTAFVLLYIILHRSSGGTSQQASPANAALAYSENMAQVNAADSSQANQIQAQLDMAQLSAQVQNQQNADAVQESQQTNDASLAAALIQGYETNQNNELAAQTSVANQTSLLQYTQNVQQMQDTTLEDQIGAGVLENANNNSTNLQALTSQLDYQTGANELGAAVDLQGMQDQYSLDQGAQSLIGKAGLNHGTASLESGLLSALNGTTGNAAIGVANANAAGSAAVASSAAGASILNSLSSLGGKIAGGLL